MLLKMGVDISRLADPMRRALSVIERVCVQTGIEPIVTSTYEGTHSPASLHYVNRALDLRLLPPDVVARLKKELGTGYDVVSEPTHVHIEHDPK